MQLIDARPGRGVQTAGTQSLSCLLGKAKLGWVGDEPHGHGVFGMVDGVLLLDRLDEDQRKDAKRAVRELQMRISEPAEACLTPEPRSRTSFFRLR